MRRGLFRYQILGFDANDAGWREVIISGLVSSRNRCHTEKYKKKKSPMRVPNDESSDPGGLETKMPHTSNILDFMRGLRPVLAALLLLPLPLFATNGQPDAVDAQMAGMTLRQKVGQMFIFGYSGTQPDTGLKRLIEKEQPGALITFARNIITLEQIRSVNRQAQAWSQAISKVPLLIMVDQEGGNVARLKVGTSLPSALSLGETKDPNLIQDYAHALGLLMCKLGFNVNLAPVLDLSDPQSISFIGPRSFGGRPDGVAPLANAFAKGLADSGVIPTAKHFPGHGGIAADSHQTTPRKLSTLEELVSGDLVPFRYFASADFPRAVMMAHISYPQIDPSGAPSAFSSVLIEDVLRGRMKYDGLIITDDVEMNGANIAGTMEERSVRAIEAGNDMVMVAWSAQRQERSLEAVYKAVEDGTIPVARINRSVRKILEYKLRLRDHKEPQESVAMLRASLDKYSQHVKRYNFMKAVTANASLRGYLRHSAPVTLMASDRRFFENFTQQYRGPVRFLQLAPDVRDELETRILSSPSGIFVYYASGTRTARWLNQLTPDIKKHIIVVNANQAGMIDGRRGFLGIFQMNTLAAESGKWLAKFLTDRPSKHLPFFL